ncbi:PASTA domain-containing protein [Enterococcus sp. LJL51]|uniref:PASTA domain-containing protein n=1 Tax=Enterococcus sp. LJL51 TaxID=3416656 RepID=UPI003CEFED76
MSDFLSNFSGGNYEKTRQDKLYDKSKGKKKEAVKPEKTDAESLETAQNQVKSDHQQPVRQPETVAQKPVVESQRPDEGDLSVEDMLRARKKEKKVRKVKEPTVKKTPAPRPVSNDGEYGDELMEVDTGYRRKKIIKYVIFALLAVGVIALGFFGYYQMSHVKVPDFTGKELAEVRTWSTENDVKLKVEQIYDFEAETNTIISQSKKTGKIKKGTELTVDASLGPDPEEGLPLPDFGTMNRTEVSDWILQNKADNLSVIEEYSASKASGEFIKLEMVSKDVTAETYKRKDKAKVYYSKGPEVYEKTIEVPDFTGKTKEEVEEWTKKNELTIEVSENDSDTVDAGKVISQKEAKGTKLAKKDKFPVVISAGKAYVVPDYSQVSMKSAEGNADIQVVQLYNDTVPYGGFVSQSIAAGETFKASQKPGVQVTYSIGKPFLKDLRNDTMEGDVQKIFYDEYQQKGAPLTYQIYYIDSEVTKGTVVEMSNYNEFVPTNAVIRIGISRGNVTKQEQKNSENPTD